MVKKGIRGVYRGSGAVRSKRHRAASAEDGRPFVFRTFPGRSDGADVRGFQNIHSYGMDVWLWYPNVGRDYHDFGCIDREMEERRRVFSAIPYLDAMLVPLGIPVPSGRRMRCV